MRDKLKNHIAAVVEGIRHLSIDEADDLIAEIGDQLACEEDVIADAILDGLCWGYRAAVMVDLSGGAMMRVIMPGGQRITHEWDSARDAEPQIKARLEAVIADRNIADGVGE